MKKRPLFVIIICLSMIMGACGSSKTESLDPIDISPEAVEVNATGFIEANEGGQVVCKTSDGTRVAVEIPPKALQQSIDITLSVKPVENSDVLYMIRIHPVGLKLLDSASLTVEYPEAIEGIPGIGLFASSDDIGPVPLKQNQLENITRGSLYSLGDYIASRYDLDGALDISTRLRDAKTQESWQSLLTVFNGIIWVANYFHQNEEMEEALTCFESIPVICGDGLEFFLTQSMPDYGDAIMAHKKALEKYKYIQKLSSDQGVLLIDLDGK